jgi:hypothetical protein
MRSYLLLVVLPLGVVFPCLAAAGEAAQKQVARMEKLVEEPLVDPQAFPDKMPLEELLKALQDHLPSDRKVALRLDRQALGKDLARVSKVQVRLPPAKVKVSLHWVLCLVLDRVRPTVRLDYAVDAEGVLVTRPERALRQREYAVGEILPHVTRLVPTLEQGESGTFHDIDPKDDLALLIHLLRLEPEERLQVHNGIRLVVQAGPIRHDEIADILGALRRMCDVAVVMNARLYEVDRAFYQREVAPLWAGKGQERPALRRIKAPLLRKILEQKLILESDEARLLPGQRRSFLSHQSVFQYPGSRAKGREAKARNGLTGVSFQVVPEVSADRRFLRLRITQKAVQLLGVSTTRTVDLFTDKEVETATPSLRRTTLEETIRIPDSGAILMPVSYLPPDAKKDRVWLMVARPLIWIKEEVLEILNEGGDPSPQNVWETDVPEEDEGGGS